MVQGELRSLSLALFLKEMSSTYTAVLRKVFLQKRISVATMSKGIMGNGGLPLLD